MKEARKCSQSTRCSFKMKTNNFFFIKNLYTLLISFICLSLMKVYTDRTLWSAKLGMTAPSLCPHPLWLATICLVTYCSIVFCLRGDRKLISYCIRHANELIFKNLTHLSRTNAFFCLFCFFVFEEPMPFNTHTQTQTPATNATNGRKFQLQTHRWRHMFGDGAP